LSKIYKAWTISVDRQNVIPINPQESPPEVIEIPGAAQTNVQAAEIEAMTTNMRQKAHANAKDIVDTATKEAGSILSKARQEAETLTQEAKLAIEQERAAVLLEAEKRGYEIGLEKGNIEADAIIGKANEYKNETATQREAAITRLEPELVELIIRIVKKLISDTAKVNPQVVLHLIRQGLKQTSFTGDITLRVASEDYDSAVSHKDELLKSVEGGAKLKILKDLALSPGDCLIETPFGVIDSSLDMQFEEVKESLRLILHDDTSNAGDGSV
jgi:flagellar assembly protein FliH